MVTALHALIPGQIQMQANQQQTRLPDHKMGKTLKAPPVPLAPSPAKKPRLSALFSPAKVGNKGEEAKQAWQLSMLEDIVGLSAVETKTVTFFVSNWSMPAGVGKPINLVVGDRVGRTMRASLWGPRIDAVLPILANSTVGVDFPIFRFGGARGVREASRINLVNQKVYMKEWRMNVSDTRSVDPVHIPASLLDRYPHIFHPTTMPPASVTKQLLRERFGIPLIEHVTLMMGTLRHAPSLPFKLYVLSTRAETAEKALYVVGDRSAVAVLSLPLEQTPMTIHEEEDTVVYGVGFDYCFAHITSSQWSGFDEGRPILVLSHGHHASYTEDKEDVTDEAVAQAPKLYLDAQMNDCVHQKADRF